MARPPVQIVQHLELKFPRPKVDPEWLQGCYNWLIEQPGANPSSQKFLDDVESQLLSSDLQDSMLPGTGLPVQSEHREAKTRLPGTPILVEIVAITEIAHSAYQLDQIRIAREERMRAGQTDDDEGEGDLEVEGEGPMPKYPRGMLKLELFDGTTTLSAIEYRPLPEIVLGKTQLGYKMLLKNPMLQRGIAFLEPNTVELIGYQTADRESSQLTQFAYGLRARMGLPLPPLPVEDENETQQSIPQPAVTVRSPLREISPPPETPLHSTYNEDANLEPSRRKLPSTNITLIPTPNSSASSATLVPSGNSAITSQYFFNSSISSGAELNGLSLSLTSAQASQAPAKGNENDDDDDDDDLFRHFDSIDIEKDENLPPSLLTQRPTATPALNLGSSVPRPLAPEESIEIVSFTPSQTSTGTSVIDRGKAPERGNGSSTTRVINAVGVDESGNLGPSTTPTASLASVGDDVRVQSRPIKPLPKARTSLPPFEQSQPRRSQSLPQSQVHPRSQPRAKEVIEVDSSPPSSSPSPSIVPQKPLPKVVVELELLEDADDEEQYDKENKPVSTRRVRRKVVHNEKAPTASELVGNSNPGQRGARATRVIELSDED